MYMSRVFLSFSQGDLQYWAHGIKGTDSLDVELYILGFIGLTRSEKTSVMTTPKRPGVQLWQI